MKDNKKKKKKTAGDVVLTLVLLLAVGVFCYAAFNLYHIYTEYKKGSDEYNQIAQMAVTERDPDEDPIDMETDEQKSNLKAPMKIDFDTLRSVNTDVIGWIYVEALDNVSYPIVKGKDNSTYLHMTYEKNYNFAGTIFIDYENSGDFNDCNTLVYGHNMKNGSMFGTLKKFEEQETYDKCPYFWIFTPEFIYQYQIFSCSRVYKIGDPYRTRFTTEEFQNFINNCIANSAINNGGMSVTTDDRIVTLSTCTGDDSTRLIVQGKLAQIYISK